MVLEFLLIELNTMKIIYRQTSGINLKFSGIIPILFHKKALL